MSLTVTLACSLCATPKASLTYTSPSAASCCVNAGSLAASPLWKRKFSSRHACSGWGVQQDMAAVVEQQEAAEVCWVCAFRQKMLQCV